MNLCFRNAVHKSCPHLMVNSSNEQSLRLSNAGYPTHIQISIAEASVKKHMSKQSLPQETSLTPPKFAVVPYMHGVSQNLKKIGARASVKVVFSAPKKLATLFKMKSSDTKVNRGCSKKHKNPFVSCAENVVYQIPLGVSSM